MNFYIKEWPDNTASLITEGGHVVWIFPSVEEAEEAAVNSGEIAVAGKSLPQKKKFDSKAVA
jgi:sorbitol-specific phosphotransferase system component IIA